MVIEIFTNADCQYCAAARRLLRKRNLEFKETVLGKDSGLSGKLVEQTQQTTTPHVFIDGEHIGGFEELVELDQEGGLG